ncbi:hypothetical protein J1P26_21800 [Neobacillus sp. MM2021_6]|uniref:hypothetical protein n=1 Tax=Bacillaceae TaxID=186817 RepID=UPI00140C1B5A|nr:MULTISPECIES: hypothetical protein [Bacillaceae]MBO0962341.1 hypothetical protein [Neobacillus sp. MM2021_6]NHC20824.1 hypothetical protein [Bacillus sp. MM2020_4]
MPKLKKEPKKIICEGPVDQNNGALIFRLQRKDEIFDMYKGQVLVVGDEISKEEAKELVENTTWKFREVKS